MSVTLIITGSGDIQLSTVRKHGGSSDHQNASTYLDKDTRATSDISDDEIPGPTPSITKDDKILFNTVYTVAKEELPSEKVNSLLTMQRKNELDVKYRNLSWDTISDIQKSIGKVITSDLVSDINASPTYAIMLDESTDISIQKHLSICVRYEKNGKAVCKFLTNSYVRDGKAHTIVNCIANEFQRLGICLSKCTSLATDGAAVMTGKKTGVGVQMRSKFCPFVTTTHCVAHRLNLACGDSMKKDEYLSKFKIKFNDLYLFMSSSSVRTTTLKEIQELLDEPSLTMKEPHSIRWMGLRNAVLAVHQSYGAVLATLSKFAGDGNPTAKNLHKFFANYKTALVVGLMLDIHDELAILSCKFQEATLMFSEVQAELDGTVNKLQTMASTDGPSLVDMKDRIRVEEGIARYQGNETLSYKVTMDEEFSRIRQSYVDKLKKNVRNRLRKEDGDVFADLSRVLEPETVNDTAKDERLQSVISLGQFYGYEKETVIVEGDIDNAIETRKKVPPLLNPNELEQEWPRLEGMIEGAYREYSTQKLCRKIIKNHKSTLPNFAILASVALVMTVSSVECERTFSAQNRLKVKYRSSMKSETLDVLMKIAMLGPDVEDFDCSKAIGQWLREKKRRKKRLCDEYRPRKKQRFDSPAK